MQLLEDYFGTYFCALQFFSLTQLYLYCRVRVTCYISALCRAGLFAEFPGIFLRNFCRLFVFFRQCFPLQIKYASFACKICSRTYKICFLFQATMLKKRKRKVKRRNTEPSVSRPGSPVKGAVASTPPVPLSAPPDRGAGSSGSASGSSMPTPNLADLCDSPSHATPV